MGRSVAIIGGASPHLSFVPIDQWCAIPGVSVYGVNDFGQRHRCDWTVIQDTHILPDWQYWMDERRAEGMKVAARVPNTLHPRELDVRPEMADHWFECMKGDYQKEGTERLAFACTTATTAVDLAVRHGHQDIILAGIDLVGVARECGHRYSNPEWFSRLAPWVVPLLETIMHHTGCRIYATNPESLLITAQMPYLPPESVTEMLLRSERRA